MAETEERKYARVEGSCIEQTGEFYGHGQTMEQKRVVKLGVDISRRYLLSACQVKTVYGRIQDDRYLFIPLPITGDIFHQCASSMWASYNKFCRWSQEREEHP